MRGPGFSIQTCASAKLLTTWASNRSRNSIARSNASFVNPPANSARVYHLQASVKLKRVPKGRTASANPKYVGLVIRVLMGPWHLESIASPLIGAQKTHRFWQAMPSAAARPSSCYWHEKAEHSKHCCSNRFLAAVNSSD